MVNVIGSDRVMRDSLSTSEGLSAQHMHERQSASVNEGFGPHKEVRLTRRAYFSATDSVSLFKGRLSSVSAGIWRSWPPTAITS